MMFQWWRRPYTLSARAREHNQMRSSPSPMVITALQLNIEQNIAATSFINSNRLTGRCSSSSAVVKATNGSSPPLFDAIIALVMSIAAMLRVSRNMPRKVLGAAIGGSRSATLAKSKSKIQVRQRSSKISPEAVKAAEQAVSAKRLADLEEKVIALLTQPAAMPADKEEMLQATVNRVSALEEELAATQKVSS
jgi:hypothetical protein